MPSKRPSSSTPAIAVRYELPDNGMERPPPADAQAETDALREVILGPQRGPQKRFLASKAHIAIYGGAAGGGKTWALLMQPLLHRGREDFTAVFFRRTTVQVRNPGGLWDESLAYVVNGILGQLQIITPGGGSTTPSGGSGGAPGTALLNDSVAGSGKTFTCPSGSYAHVDIGITGLAGSGNGQYTGGKGGSFIDTGGGGGGVVVVKGFPVTPGTTVFTYTLPSSVGADATCTATGLSLTAHSGTSASAGASGTGAAASSGNTATGATSVTAYAGHNGGLTDTWDGGGPGATINVSSGTVTSPGPDNASDGAAGVIPGQGGAGSVLFGIQAGGGCNLLIIART